MHRLQVLICRVDDQHPDEKTQIAAFDLPTLDVTTLQPETFLDELEASTQVIGHAILRRTLQARWEMVDATLAVQYTAGHALEEVQADGYAPVAVASRFGMVSLCRQVLVHSATNTHVVPGNAVLPAHEGRITTRGLQEWACTLAQDLPFVTVARLLGWQTQEEQILSDMTIRRLVRQHGQLIAQAEQAEITSLLEHVEDPAARPQLVAPTRPRRRAGWPAALSAAVDAALVHEQPRPPSGVSWADWQRVLTARRAEATLPTEQLRLLRPQLEPGQILLTVDEVLARSQEKRHFVALHTAHLVTAAGQRYLCGTGDTFLQKVLLLARLCLGTERSLLLIADGARWIRSFFQEQVAALPQATMLLDWYHLEQKCRDLCSRIGRPRMVKGQLLQRLYRRLWGGDVPAALQVLEEQRPHVKNVEALDSLISYLQARVEWIPNDRQRRREQQYIGSGQGEKANDLLVARRQKRRGMQWSAATSASLATLSMLRLNGAWDLYWQQREVLPLAA